MLIGSELLSYRTEGLFLFVYRSLLENSRFELSGWGSVHHEQSQQPRTKNYGELAHRNPKSLFVFQG